MAHQGRQPEQWEAANLAKEFIEKDMLPENVENDVIRHLDSQEPIRALQTILEHRKG